MTIGLQAARGAATGGVAAAATFGAARLADPGPETALERRVALPVAAAGIGVAALVLGAARPGAARGLLLGGGTGALLGAAGAMLLAGRSSQVASPASPVGRPAPAPERDTPPASSPPSTPTPASPSPSPSPVDATPAASPSESASASPTAPSPAAPAPVDVKPAPTAPTPPPVDAKPAPPAPKPAPVAPAPAAEKPARPAPVLKVGSTGPAVSALQARLAELGYAVDSGGTYTTATRDAVMAFQKVNGLDRDGVAGPKTRDAMKQPRQPQLGAGKPNRIDVDLSTQTMVVVRNNRVAYIVNATSGNPDHPDGKGIATPRGTFSVQRKIAGTRHAPLGDLYYPSYFRGGVAVHGSNSVVAQRDSHGCVRIPRWLEQRVYADMPVGSQVVVHD